jgi:hypothetical protein
MEWGHAHGGALNKSKEVGLSKATGDCSSGYTWKSCRKYFWVVKVQPSKAGNSLEE